MNYCNMQKEQFEESGDKLIVNAPAKINLYLMIAGKRPDGYHNIDTLMSKITWYDQVIIEPSDNEGVELACTGSYWAPQNDDNLIIKAVKALNDDCGFNESIRITLQKNIPAGTGLGSASSDAAATLLGLNKYFSLGISKQRLAKIAAKFGSDTAFFTGNSLAVCKGRGEILHELETDINYQALLIIPNISMPTVEVYRNYSHDEEIYYNSAHKINPLMSSNNVLEAASLGINMLAESCFDINGKMSEIYREADDVLGGGVVLSGSGSAFYKILSDENTQEIDELMRSLKDRLGCNIILVSNNRW